MKNILIHLFMLCAFVSTVCGSEEILGLSRLTSAPVYHIAEFRESTDNLTAIYYDALDYKGKATKVFAWLGLPKNPTGKVPGIVLVHGGGGSAFKEWVKKWNNHGFAAISIAVEGQTDVRDASNHWKKHDWPGPARQGIYGDSAEPLKEQWMYHAVADTILANSLLRSLPEVEAGNVGVMGISWGGVITSTVMGLDDRFAFAIPVYGCGNLAEADNRYGRSLGNNEIYNTVWDPMLRLDRAAMPSLWLSWPGDQHFPLDKQASCYKAMSGQYMVTLIPGMQHGHKAAWDRPESYAFAREIVESGAPWCFQNSVYSSGGHVEVSFESQELMDGAVLVSTIESGVTGSREWVESKADMWMEGEGQCRVMASLPPGTTAWFINVQSGDLIVSSDLQTIP